MTPNPTVTPLSSNSQTFTNILKLVDVAGRGRLDIEVVPQEAIYVEEVCYVSLRLEMIQVLRAVELRLRGQTCSESQLFERVYNG